MKTTLDVVSLEESMSYKIVVDSCCELPEDLRKDPRFEVVPLGLEVGDYRIMDDENFDQKLFLKKVAECPVCPKSSCPSPERYRKACETDADRVYIVTLSSNLSGSHNSALLGKNLYLEKEGEKRIHVVDSRSASCGETQIALKAMELEEQGLPFETIVERLEEFRNGMHTYFVLDNLETLRKNGRLTGVKALVASTLNIKPVMAGDERGHYRADRAGDRDQESAAEDGGCGGQECGAGAGEGAHDHSLQQSGTGGVYEETDSGEDPGKGCAGDGYGRYQQHVCQ